MEAHSFLDNTELRLVLFGGKGGCGKTTSAAAASIRFAGMMPEKKVLVISTDPAHSLGDSFGMPVGDQAAQVKEIDNLWLLEIDVRSLYEEFRSRYEGQIKRLAERGTYFDKDDIESFFSLSLPGMDEVMAVIEVANILKSGTYDLVVLDTAPTGHTLRLLALPAQMERWVAVLGMMQDKYRFLKRHYTGRYKRDDADDFLEMMETDLGGVKALLKNDRETEFVPVTIPEPMAIDETERLLTSLRDYGISVKSIIANKVTEQAECPFCASRRKEMGASLRRIEENFAGYKIISMPLFPYEIKGLERLTEFGGYLFRDEREYLSFVELKPGTQDSGQSSMLFSPFTSLSDLFDKTDREFLIFGGKGGVGKTTIAAVTALCTAGANPDKRILIMSTDPAHSLSDSFGCRIGDEITRIDAEGQLYALETDAEKMLNVFKNEYRTSIEEVFDRFVAGGIDIKFDREVLVELIDLSPPGLDEIMALKRMMDLVGSYDLFILDTAPTGHLLRFLETPEIALDWLKAFMRLLLKYKGVISLGKAAERVLKLTQDVRRIKEALADAAKTEFIGITIPEDMSMAETGRLLGSLKKLGVPCRRIIVNMVMPLTECNFCLMKRKEEERYLRQMDAAWGKEYAITAFPLLPYPIKGISRMTELCKLTPSPPQPSP